jgi:DNA-binding response OmpR family regulator
VAITGHTDQGHKTLAIKAGFDAVLFKPVAPTEIEAVLASVVVANAGRAARLHDAIENPYPSRKRSSHL